MTILSYVGTLLLGIFCGYCLRDRKIEPQAIEKHWIGYSVQERWHYEDTHDYISKN